MTTSIYFVSSVYVLFISLMQLVNGAQFLNVTPLFLPSNLFAASSALAPQIIVIVSL